MASTVAGDIRWFADVAEHDYHAAFEYLSLRLDAKRAKRLVKKLRKAKVTKRRANDILRACDREPLGYADPGVRRDREKVRRGGRLSPILVVSWKFGADLADGYHRCSLQYEIDPFADVPLKIATE